MDQLVGMETRRMLRAGEIVRIDDVRHPVAGRQGLDRHHDVRSARRDR